VRFQLLALAYNLANFLRSLALPDPIAQWSLTTLRERLVKIGARIVRHGRYLVFQLAEVAVPRAVFAAKCAFRLTGNRRRSRVPGGNRAHLGNSGLAGSLSRVKQGEGMR
jgi:hypothetical protein